MSERLEEGEGGGVGQAVVGQRRGHETSDRIRYRLHENYICTSDFLCHSRFHSSSLSPIPSPAHAFTFPQYLDVTIPQPLRLSLPSPAQSLSLLIIFSSAPEHLRLEPCLLRPISRARAHARIMSEAGQMIRAYTCS